MSYRTELESLMRSTIKAEQNYQNWFYTQIRPQLVPDNWWPKKTIWGDCSKGVQFLCKWANIPSEKDPMGNRYGGYGNSQTLWLHLHHLDSAKELEIGDIVTFGHDGEEHAAMVLEADKVHGNPLLWGFGHQGAPNATRLSEDHRERQFLRLSVPIAPPTSEDKLRAKTGWFMWVAWKLGEGAWKHYGKANKKVRPNVPKFIPLSWWKRYAKFLLNRKKGS